MNKADLYIFDLDGTLVDSASTVLDIINQIRVLYGLDKINIDNLRPYLNKGGKLIVKEYLPISNNLNANLNIFREYYEKHNLINENLYSGVKEFLLKAKSNGKKLAICTNKPKKLAFKTIRHHNLTHLFDCIITANDVKNIKPAPDGLMSTLLITGINRRDAIFFGDSDIDRVAAINAGIDFYLHLSGYNDCQSNLGIKLHFNKYQDF